MFDNLNSSSTDTRSPRATRSPALWLLVAAVLLGGGQLGVLLLGSSWSLQPGTPPEIDFERWPLKLGSWQGRVTAIDPRLIQASHAAQAGTWLYRNRAGEEILVHFGVWVEYKMDPPHLPTACYRGAGWTLLDERRLSLPSSRGKKISVLCHHFRRGEERVMVLTWYPMGTQTVLDREDVRRVRQEARHGGELPVAMKFMLQTDATDPARAEQRLLELGVLLSQQAPPQVIAGR